MVFWLAVLVGALFAWIAVQIGFYATWIMFFNLVLSAYVGMFLTPVVITMVPAATETPYGYAPGADERRHRHVVDRLWDLTFACLSGQLRVDVSQGVRQHRRGLAGLSDRLPGFEFRGVCRLADAIVPRR